MYLDLRYLVKMKQSHFTLIYDPCIERDRDVKHNIHQVKKKIDSHEVCSKCLPLARTQARKHVGHWSTALLNDRPNGKIHWNEV